jgi:hypothetical protein
MFFLSCGIFSFSSVSVRTGFRFRRRVHLFAQVSQIRAVFFPQFSVLGFLICVLLLPAYALDFSSGQFSNVFSLFLA